jgi:glycosyltransferase involved in cell wall biosynthesis
MSQIKNILIVAPFVSLPGESYFNRFLYLAYMWSKEYKVTLVTSRFFHFLKNHRDREADCYRDLPFELVLLDEPGYRKNVSFARIASHRRFTAALKEWLTGQIGKRRFDVAYSAYPLIDSNIILADFKRLLGFKLVIDVQDVWPESIAAAFPILGRYNVLLWPITRMADRAYAAADALVAVSETYLARARRKCPEKSGMVAYLGSDRGMVDSIPAASLPSGVFRLVYLGTLSHSYDMTTVVNGVNILRKRYSHIELHILGDGPHRQDIQAIAGEGIVFYGFVPYEKMVGITKCCDLAINPIVKSAAASITNKISDYFTLGLPILSSQRNPEVVELIQQAGGEHYEAENVKSFCDAVERFMQASHKDEIRARTRKLGIELFDRAVYYPKITAFLQSIVKDRTNAYEHETSL